MDNDGITIKTPKSIMPLDKGNLSLTIEGSVDLTVTGEVNVNASSVNLTSSDATIKSSGKS